MAVFGKTLTDYVAFARVILIVTAVIGFIRLGLSVGGAPNNIAIWFSPNAVGFFGMFYFGIRTHTSGFGTYRHVLILLAIQILVSQSIIALGISITAVTGVENIFSVPEMSIGSNHWVHAASHLAGGPTVGTIVQWIPASTVMFATKSMIKTPSDA